VITLLCLPTTATAQVFFGNEDMGPNVNIGVGEEVESVTVNRNGNLHNYGTIGTATVAHLGALTNYSGGTIEEITVEWGSLNNYGKITEGTFNGGISNNHSGGEIEIAAFNGGASNNHSGGEIGEATINGGCLLNWGRIGNVAVNGFPSDGEDLVNHAGGIIENARLNSGTFHNSGRIDNLTYVSGVYHDMWWNGASIGTLVIDDNCDGINCAGERENYWGSVDNPITCLSRDAECEHDWTRMANADYTAPTCTLKGYWVSWYECTKCEEIGNCYYDYVDALDHDFAKIEWDGFGWLHSDCSRCEWAGYLDYTPPAAKLETVELSAFVTKLNGNKNNLTTTVTEYYSDGSVVVFTETFSINNNAAGTYTVGDYKVYVDTKGNDQIRACYIVD
jgi:hypothetical protein